MIKKKKKKELLYLLNVIAIAIKFFGNIWWPRKSLDVNDDLHPHVICECNKWKLYKINVTQGQITKHTKHNENQKKNDIWNEPLCCSLPHRFPANWQIIIRIKVNSTFGRLHSSTCLFFGCIAIQFNSIQFSVFVCFTAFVNVLVFVFVVVVVVVVTATAILQLDIWFHWN